MSITIRKPQKDRKSFSLSKVIVDNNGIRTQTKMKLASVDSVNKNFHSKQIDYNQAITLLKDDRDTIYYKLESNTQYSHENRRRLVCRVNALLTFIGRGFKIPKLKAKQIRKISHITEKELERFVIELKNEIDKVACRIIFYTGLRTGELFGFTLSDVDFEKNLINIDKQLTRDFKIEPPKSNKERDVIFPDLLKEDLKKWFEFKDSEKELARNNLSKRFLSASRRIWGKVKHRDISPHDLRRSFAIHLIVEKDFSVTNVAFLLGDTEAVVQKYYSGYTISQNMAEMLLKKLG